MNSKRWKILSIFFFALAFKAVIAKAAPAVNEPAGINLGGTSFYDGFGGTSPGFVYQQYFQYQHLDAINDTHGNAVSAFKGTDINVYTSLNQFIYTTAYRLFGGAIAVNVLLPIVHLAATFASDSPSVLTANDSLLGDLTWGPSIQFSPITYKGRPVFDQRVELDIISPVGSYNPHQDINPGANFWSINPYYAFTVVPTPDFELSCRVFYLHNFANHDPASSTPIASGTTTQAGDAAWINFAASFAETDRLNVGVNGYYFRQFSADKVNGIKQPHSLTTILSLGPGIMFQAEKADTFFINAYLPIVADNTTSGIHLVFRWIHVF